MTESIGAINVNKMIWTSTALTLGSLYLCVSHILFSGRPVKFKIQL
jgi:hypothetical protein